MPKISEQDLVQIPSLLSGGQTLQQVADRLGVTVKAIGYHCKKNGWQTRFAARQSRNRKLEEQGRKQCASCDEERDLNQFDKDPRAIGGLSSQCKVCRNLVIRQWQQTHMSSVLAASRDWKGRNPEYTQAYSAQYYRDHKEERKAYLRSWFKRNPGMCKHYRILRDARERGAAGQFTPEQLKARVDYYGGRCYLCGCDWYALPKQDQTIDHVIALSQGGANWPSNLRPACRSCNSAKH